MISRKELGYVNCWANKVPYPGREYCEEAMDKLIEGLDLFNKQYSNSKYNIIFSNQEEIQMEIKQKNINHMLGIDYKNLSSEFFRNFRRNILGCNQNTNIPSYEMLNLIAENRDKVLDYDENSNSKAINYYKISIKADIFKKLADLSKFNYGCINFDRDKFLQESNGKYFSSNSTKFLYTESDESVSPYFFMGLKKDEITSLNNSVDIDEMEYRDDEEDSYIVETLIAPENYQYFFNNQEIVIPTQVLTDINGCLSKNSATPEEKIKLLKEYKSIINQYELPNMINIYGDYLSCLMDSQRGKILTK